MTRFIDGRSSAAPKSISGFRQKMLSKPRLDRKYPVCPELQNDPV
jgi:hypothetical protein